MIDVVVSITCICFEKWSTKMQIALKPLDSGSSPMRLMVMSCQGASGIWWGLRGLVHVVLNVLETTDLANPWNYSKWTTSSIKPKVVIDNGLFSFLFLFLIILYPWHHCRILVSHGFSPSSGFSHWVCQWGFLPSDLVIDLHKSWWPWHFLTNVYSHSPILIPFITNHLLTVLFISFSLLINITCHHLTSLSR